MSSSQRIKLLNYVCLKKNHNLCFEALWIFFVENNNNKKTCSLHWGIKHGSVYLQQWWITLVEVIDRWSWHPLFDPGARSVSSQTVSELKPALTGCNAKPGDPASIRSLSTRPRPLSFVFICLEAHNNRWVQWGRRHFAATSTTRARGVMEHPSAQIYWSLWQAIHFSALSAFVRNAQMPPVVCEQIDVSWFLGQL